MRIFHESDVVRDAAGRFAKQLTSGRTGQKLRRKANGTAVKLGAIRSGGRSRRVYSVEGGQIHRDPMRAAIEAVELDGPEGAPERMAYSGPKTHTGWLGRYRKMDREDLEQELAWLEEGNGDPAVAKVRLNALRSALAEKRGEKTIQKRPGASKKDPQPDIVGNSQFAAVARETAKEIERIKKAHGREVPVSNPEKIREMVKLSNLIQDRKRIESIQRVEPDSNVWPARIEYLDEAIAKQTAKINAIADENFETVIDRKGLDKIGKLVNDLANIHRRHDTQEKFKYADALDTLRTKRRTAMDKAKGFTFGSPEREALFKEINEIDRKLEALRKGSPHASPKLKRLEEQENKLLNEVDSVSKDLAAVKAQLKRKWDEWREANPYGDNMRQWSETITYTALTGEINRLEAELKKANKKLQPIVRGIYIERKSERSRNQAHVLAALKAVRPGYGTGKMKMERKPAGISDIFEKAQTLYPKEWMDAINEKYPDGIRVKQEGYRANWKEWIRTITIDSRSKRDEIAAHEMAHAVESSRSAIKRMEAEFYEYRTQGEPLKKLAELHPGHGYRAHEVTKVDKFITPYMGRYYENGSRELLSVGMEAVFYDYKAMDERDPEMFRWLLGLMAAG